MVREMPDSKDMDCVPLLKALADESRWSIVRSLMKEPLTVGQLATTLSMSQYNVSKHLRILRESGVVTTDRLGKHVQCQISPSFRHSLDKTGSQLDLGCCSFYFD